MEEVWTRYYKNAQAQGAKTISKTKGASNSNILQDDKDSKVKDDGAESTSLKHGRLPIVALVNDGKDTALKTFQNASTLSNTSAAQANKSKSIDSKDTVAVDEGEKLIDISTDDDEKTTTTEEDEEEMKTLVDIWFEQHRKKRAAAVAAKEKAKVQAKRDTAVDKENDVTKSSTEGPKNKSIFSSLFPKKEACG